MSQYFDVKVDGRSIFDVTDKQKHLINPVVKNSIEEAGSFDFTLDRTSDFYNAITPYGSDIEVFEDGNSIFFGRALPPRINIFNQKTYHCEGALAFLNDIILAPMEKFVIPDFSDGENEGDEGDFSSGDDIEPDPDNGLVQRTVNIEEYLQLVFQKYNETQTKASRKLIFRGTTIGATILYNSDYKSCFDIIKSEILEYIDGYMVAERVGNNTYVDIKTSFPSGGQPITAGANLLDFTASGDTFYTACIAKGGRVKNEKGEMEDVMMDTPVVIGAASTYGVICAYKHFPQCTTVEDLQAACQSFLADQQFNNLLFEVSAVDLHISNSEYASLKAGQSVQFYSKQHGIKTTVVVSAVEVHLDTGEKTVTLGSRKRAQTAHSSFTYNMAKQVNDLSKNKEAVKPYDITPTEGSVNPVTSGGIYDAMEHWEHQIDGVTQKTGTVNFITV